MVKILLFLLIFGLIVIAHEFGHFLLAKMNGIRVLEFSVGMGPIICKFQGKETLYTLRLLPIGGACMFEQEDGLETAHNHTEDTGKEVEEGSFAAASVWARIATVVAGPLFNFLLAYILSLFVVGMSGSDSPTIYSVIEGYPAQEAGLQAGDEIISLNGERVHLYREVSFISSTNRGEDVEMVYERDGERYTTVITPRYDEEEGRYYIGFSGGVYEKGNAWELIKNSYYEVRYWVKITFKSLLMLFNGQASVKDMSGPVGMAQVVGDVYDEASAYGIETVIVSMLNIAILLSANLGVVNLLPLPALDGGRLIFLIIEVFRGKPVPKEKEAIIHFIGFALLMVLMVFVLYNDIVRLFQ